MSTSSPGQLNPSDPNPSDSSDYSLLDNVVIFPDGSVTWATASATPPDVIPTVACEVVPEGHSLIDECIQMLQPHSPEIFVMVPEFAPRQALKATRRS
jgi:hypothetical protein